MSVTALVAFLSSATENRTYIQHILPTGRPSADPKFKRVKQCLATQSAHAHPPAMHISECPVDPRFGADALGTRLELRRGSAAKMARVVSWLGASLSRDAAVFFGESAVPCGCGKQVHSAHRSDQNLKDGARLDARQSTCAVRVQNVQCMLCVCA